MRPPGAVLHDELNAIERVADDDRLLPGEAVVVQLHVQPLLVANHVEADAQAVARDHADQRSTLACSTPPYANSPNTGSRVTIVACVRSAPQ